MISRSAEDIARRAELATMKAPYKPLEDALGGIAKAQRPTGTLSLPAARDDSGQMAKMLEQISQLNQTVMKLTNQVGDLLEENRTLRKQLETKAPSVTMGI